VPDAVPRHAPGTTRTVANAVLVLREDATPGRLTLEGEGIAAVDPGATGTTDGAGALDWGGDYALPGLIDLHTDHLERHFVPRPGVHWDPVHAAIAHDAQVAAAGITTVFDAIALVSGTGDRDRAQMLAPMADGLRRAQAAGMLRAEHFLHLRCEVTDPEIFRLIEPFDGDGLVRFMSLMDHTPGQRQFPDLDRVRENYRRHLGLSDDEVDRYIEEQMARQRELGPRQRRALAEIGHARGVPLASHDDQTPDHVADAKHHGVAVAEFPTTREAARAARDHGLDVLMGAPNLIRGGSHSGNVAAAELAREGLLDVLASDYVPGSLIAGAFRLTAEDIGWDLPRAIAAVTATPAAVAGLEDRGVLEPGRRADLLRVGLVEGVPVVREVWRAGRRVV